MLKLLGNINNTWTELQYMDFLQYNNEPAWVTSIPYNANIAFAMLLVNGKDISGDLNGENVKDFISEDAGTGFAVVEIQQLQGIGISINSGDYIALIYLNSPPPEFRLTINTAFPDQVYSLKVPMQLVAEQNSYKNVKIELVDMNTNSGLSVSLDGTGNNTVYMVYNGSNTNVIDLQDEILAADNKIDFDFIIKAKGDFASGYYRDIAMLVQGDVVS